VLVIVDGEASLPEATAAIRAALAGQPEPELKVCRFETVGARESVFAQMSCVVNSFSKKLSS
jgi:hypothetical protein